MEHSILENWTFDMSEPIERSMLASQVCLLTTHTGTDLGSDVYKVNPGTKE